MLLNNLNCKSKFVSVIIFFIFTSFSILLYPSKICAAWVRSDLPIIKYDSNRWDNYHTTNPFVLFNGEKYKVWYTGNGGSGWKIGYGTSDTGTNWLLQNSSILNPSGNEQHITQVLIKKEEETYKAWYSTITSNATELGYATSNDGISNWIKNSTAVFSGTPGKWDERVTDRGFSIIKVGNEYKLWYAASNSGINWRIGYATSTDGIHWTKYSGNPVITKTESWEHNNLMYPFVIYEGGKFKMWYGTGVGDSCTRYVYAESTNGYEWTKPADKNYVYNASGVAGAFDKNNIAGLSLMREGDTYKIWYSGYDGVHWSIGYATTSADPLPPTPTPIEPVVIVPGMMSSWNKEGILEGNANPTTPWKLLPFVKEYDGLIQTLKNLGYEEGKTIFLWPYDWRKSIADTAVQLNQFIDSTVKPANPGSKIHLVGHSLGGLITRTWTQTNTNANQVHHLVTIASPNRGVIQPYKAWEGGDVVQENNFFSLAGRIIVELNRRAFTTSRQIIQTHFPSLKDLLPTESYLKKNGSLVDETAMNVRNTWLTTLNTNATPIYPILETIYGIGSQTPSFYTVESPSWLDTVLGNWKDGKVIGQETADGDAVVTTGRASLTDPSVSLSQNHSNAIASTEGIKKILQALEIPATDTAIINSSPTTIQPGLLFLLRSPATLTVSYGGTSYTDFDGIIFIPNAASGTYEATVIGTGTGAYRLAVGQFSEHSYTWKEYIGNTSPGQKTIYTIPFNQTVPKEDPVTNLTEKERLNEIDIQLSELFKLSKHSSVSKAQFDLKMGIQALAKKDYFTVKKQLEQILLDMSSLRKSNPSESVRLKSFVVSDTLIDAYQAILSTKIYVINQSALTKLATLCTNEETRINAILEAKSKLGVDISLKTQTFKEGKTYRERAENMTAAEKAKQYILLFQTQLLFREIGV